MTTSETVRLLVLAVCLAYAAGRGRPFHRARLWAYRYLASAQWATGRARWVQMPAAVALLPEPFMLALWRRARYGRWDTRPPRRPAPEVRVVRRHQKQEP